MRWALVLFLGFFVCSVVFAQYYYQYWEPDSAVREFMMAYSHELSALSVAAVLAMAIRLLLSSPRAGFIHERPQNVNSLTVAIFLAIFVGLYTWNVDVGEYIALLVLIAFMAIILRIFQESRKQSESFAWGLLSIASFTMAGIASQMGQGLITFLMVVIGVVAVIKLFGKLNLSKPRPATQERIERLPIGEPFGASPATRPKESRKERKKRERVEKEVPIKADGSIDQDKINAEKKSKADRLKTSKTKIEKLYNYYVKQQTSIKYHRYLGHRPYEIETERITYRITYRTNVTKFFENLLMLIEDSIRFKKFLIMKERRQKVNEDELNKLGKEITERNKRVLKLLEEPGVKDYIFKYVCGKCNWRFFSLSKIKEQDGKREVKRELHCPVCKGTAEVVLYKIKKGGKSCPYCKKRVGENASYCPHCNKPLLTDLTESKKELIEVKKKTIAKTSADEVISELKKAIKKRDAEGFEKLINTFKEVIQMSAKGLAAILKRRALISELYKELINELIKIIYEGNAKKINQAMKGLYELRFIGSAKELTNLWKEGGREFKEAVYRIQNIKEKDIRKDMAEFIKYEAEKIKEYLINRGESQKILSDEVEKLIKSHKPIMSFRTVKEIIPIKGKAGEFKVVLTVENIGKNMIKINVEDFLPKGFEIMKSDEEIKYGKKVKHEGGEYTKLLLGKARIKPGKEKVITYIVKGFYDFHPKDLQFTP